MAFKAAPKVEKHRKIAKAVKEEMLEEGADISELRKQSVKNACVYLKDLAPALLVGGATIGCIFGLNGQHLKTEAALAAAGGIAEESYRELRQSLDKDIYKETSRERARNKYSDASIYPGYGDILCYEMHTGRYFWCTRDRVSIAESKANEHLAKTGECSINYFCNWLGLEPCPAGDISGWTTFNGQDGFMDFNGVDWINFRHDSFLIDETQTVLMIDYGVDTPPGIIV